MAPVDAAKERFQEVHPGEGFGFPSRFDYARYSYVYERTRKGGAVLDVGVGSGQLLNALGLGGEFRRVVGIDIKRHSKFEQFTEACELLPMDVAEMDFDDGAFDVVLCEEALQFIGDRGAALREMKRVAAPGGRIAFSAFRSLDRHPVYAAFARLLGEHVGEDARAMMASPFALGDADVLRSLGREAGLADVRVRIGVGRERFPSVDDFVAREAASSPLAGPLGRLDAPARRALVAALEAELAPHLDDFGLAFSNETHVVTATA
ncbi:MAG TPA: class I SAM-dependent methyltransferase [Longimicrobiales bacterium]|nr:class I SAM-dependent methyltransferase [Longimicrobiales bacterium]